MTQDQLLTESAKALQAYARFIRHFGLTDVKTDKPSPGLQQLRAEITKLNTMASQLRNLVS